MAKDPPRKGGDATRLARAGRAKDITGPFVNAPVIHASTVLFDNVAEMHSGKARYVYGRRGTPTTNALEDAITEMEGAAGTVLCPSGLNAIATALLAFASTGDRVLIPDSIYGPGRIFADDVLKRFGVEPVYYDPTIGAGISGLISPETKIVYVESPGSNTLEMQDIPAIAAAAHAASSIVISDNTWATPLYCKPLALGADVVLQAATKYVGGHSDLNMGTVSATADFWPALKRHYGNSGLCVAPDDAYLALRGLHTMSVRLDKHRLSAVKIASWLAERPEVSRVLHPALADDPGHALWTRDMTGSSGLFSFVLADADEDGAARVLDALELFGLGYSWGGFESLATIGSHRLVRTAAPVDFEGPLIRLHIGLEDADDLIADLDQALGALAR